LKPIIRIEKLGKQYRIGVRRAAYATLRETLTDGIRAPWRRLRRNNCQPDDKIWALQDVSFDVTQGEVVGIVGRNGAGKSTLLKILSRITHPTTGQVDLYGRVGSLLEVGTGFHPELSGRENIYLNGAILGMKRVEIAEKFDEIVAFAEVDKYIDTPVKRYSTGMCVRLAFAVAAHLEPEILLVDEVLAVGDAAFQKKCLGKMDSVAHQGKTVLFVSHQMPAIKSLCSRAIHVDRGRVVQDADPESVVSQYLQCAASDLCPARVWSDPEQRPGNEQVRLVSIRVVDGEGELLGTYASKEPILVEMEWDLAFLHSALCLGFDLIDRDGNTVFRSVHTDQHEREWPSLCVGRNRLQCRIPPGLLMFGSYYLAPKAFLHGISWVLNGRQEVSFDVQMNHSPSPFWNMEDRLKFPGIVAPSLPWRRLDAIRRRDTATPLGHASTESHTAGSSRRPA
jgi:lipopolysaccharide transport system ATP-binding protein